MSLLTKESVVDVLPNRAANLDSFPFHSRVLAMVEAYTRDRGAMPWRLLVAIFQHPLVRRSGLSLPLASLGSRSPLLDVVSDLTGLGLLRTTTLGTVITEAGRFYCDRQKDEFENQVQDAERLLVQLQVLNES